MGSEFIFFEKQQDLMCGQHALNMLLQNNLFSAAELGEIANRLDDIQRTLNDYPSYFVSENANASGYFSVQVLENALGHMGLSLKRITHPSMNHLLQDPSKGRAYIVNHDQHWFAVRRFGTLWFVLNSQDNGPRNITASYLNLFFTHLIANGCSIFHVEGDLSMCRADDAAFNGQLWVEELNPIKDDASLMQALRLSSESAQDDEYERALKMSAENFELEEAVKRSLMDSASSHQPKDDIVRIPTPEKVDSPTETTANATQEEVRAAREKFLSSFK